MLIAKSCFKIHENYMAVNRMINALQSIWNLDRNSLHTSVRPRLTFTLLAVYLKVWC